MVRIGFRVMSPQDLGGSIRAALAGQVDDRLSVLERRMMQHVTLTVMAAVVPPEPPQPIPVPDPTPIPELLPDPTPMPPAP